MALATAPPTPRPVVYIRAQRGSRPPVSTGDSPSWSGGNGENLSPVPWPAWWLQIFQCQSLNLRVTRSSPTLGVEPTYSNQQTTTRTPRAVAPPA